MIWLYLKRFAGAFPKLALATVVIVASTVAFGVWWFSYRMRQVVLKPVPVEDIRPKVEKVEANPGHYVLVDNALYDSESGELVFANWLKQGMPMRLFWQPREHKFLAQYERGFVRYNFNGTVDAELPNTPATTLSDDF